MKGKRRNLPRTDSYESVLKSSEAGVATLMVIIRDKEDKERALRVSSGYAHCGRRWRGERRRLWSTDDGGAVLLEKTKQQWWGSGFASVNGVYGGAAAWCGGEEGDKEGEGSIGLCGIYV
ncbi:hypothetical protein HAX54_009723 [Datura stramonium]|uniref:Uncharacterized protein n=1 Tax=Datura stramonium TaxID=4076 RepID=A0ABS8WVH9_DATST|nr:hypothetical protein [Datura stramonium]